MRTINPVERIKAHVAPGVAPFVSLFCKHSTHRTMAERFGKINATSVLYSVGKTVEGGLRRMSHRISS